jgi:hypothetical protein
MVMAISIHLTDTSLSLTFCFQTCLSLSKSYLCTTDIPYAYMQMLPCMQVLFNTNTYTIVDYDYVRSILYFYSYLMLIPIMVSTVTVTATAKAKVSTQKRITIVRPNTAG